MELKTRFYKRVNPLGFVVAFALLATVAAYHLWPTPVTIPVTATVTVFLGSFLLLVLWTALGQLGRDAPGKNFVAEVNVVHWRGMTPRFWGAYRYEWLASFAAQYIAYILDHLGNVHWEFGIQFSVYDKAARKAHQDAQELQSA